MPNWKTLLSEVRELHAAGSTYDTIRRKYLANLHEVTGRNVIVYYSGWLQKRDLSQQGYPGFALDDSDKNGLMATIHQLDRRKGLDLFLHTPGGDAAATESLVDYLRTMFQGDIRAVVPQLAMSAGTMIALSCKEIVMGKHSSLGPIDPQIFGLPAHGIIEEFDKAAEQIKNDPRVIPLWQPIISKYNPTLIGECQKAIDWCNQMVKEWLLTGMFNGEADAETKADNIIKELADHALTKSHARHISMRRAKEMGIKVVALEEDDDLQEAVLTVHHACIQTISATAACKIIENHLGVAHIEIASLAST
jgi:membrane-bound ClpP family serine protease